MSAVRVRFAPSPTGALHIGGVRTALYNYLFARHQGGKFLLRIEDTDQTRYVPGAEAYILEALAWLGLTPDEGPSEGGSYGPYRQSERRDQYARYARQLVEAGHAYFAFDTPRDLEAAREKAMADGNHSWKYDHRVRLEMDNSLGMSDEELKKRLASGDPYTIRLRVPEDEEIAIDDLIRGKVVFQGAELDDKVLLKGDGMPTYHLANIVDDHLMEISHVIRGEEWLSSTAHHVLLYRALGWEDSMPAFAHLPLILKPSGKGKLSKRDGQKLGIPVFPLAWEADREEDAFTGFREFGFLPEAVLNFLAFLGWNPGTEQEIFDLDGLVEAFSLEKIGKAGARFDFDKARWFNQQYIMKTGPSDLAQMVRPLIEARGHKPDDDFLREFCRIMRERVVLLTDFWAQGAYFFEPVREYEEKPIRKKWKPERRGQLNEVADRLAALDDFKAESVEATLKSYLEEAGLKFGDLFPFIRLAMAGTLKGPGVGEMMALFGRDESVLRLRKAADDFEKMYKALSDG